MARIAIVVGHALANTYCEALGEAYRSGAEAAGHETRVFVTAGMDFDPILREAYVRVQPREPDLDAAYQAIQSSDHLVFIFPLWLGDMPAILKGFLERLLQPELVEPSRTGKFVKVLQGKSARIIVTMGMPAFVYRWWFRAHAVKLLKRNILNFMGVSPVRTTMHGNIEGVSAKTRRHWLEEVRIMGGRAE
jgi:NAD(P)H dehydrogenase (quinone)